MSIMSDIQNEIMKPVKVGFYVFSAVIVIGGIAISANSKYGRKFLKKVGTAVTGDKPKTIENKKPDVIIDVEAEDVSATPVAVERKPKGSENV